VADAIAVWTIIVAGGVGTYLLRLSFLALFERIGAVPPRVEYALRFVPAAVLAALVAPAVVFTDGGGSAVAPAQLLAGAAAAVVAYRTESIVATIAVGLAVLVALRAVAPF
jgi:branched-subunit amino acid transport protein